MSEVSSNQIQVYTGYGKGKTTAAVGLLIRALGKGWPVALVQFDKGYDGKNEHYAERHILRQFKLLKLYPTGCERMLKSGKFRFKNMPRDFAEAQRGLNLAHSLIEKKSVKLLVLDEFLAAFMCKLLTEAELLGLIDAYEAAGRPCELVLTGHQLPSKLAERVDLITEMRKEKHYFDKGLEAREGIEY